MEFRYNKWISGGCSIFFILMYGLTAYSWIFIKPPTDVPTMILVYIMFIPNLVVGLWTWYKAIKQDKIKKV